MGLAGHDTEAPYEFAACGKELVVKKPWCSCFFSEPPFWSGWLPVGNRKRPNRDHKGATKNPLPS